MRLCEVAQQVLFAQQRMPHALSLAVLVTRQGEAGSRIVAAKSTIIIANDVVILPIIPTCSMIADPGRTPKVR